MLLRGELREVIPCFFLMRDYFATFFLDLCRFPLLNRVVGVVDDLGGCVGLLSIICIIYAVVNPLKVISNDLSSVQFLVKSLLVLLEICFCCFFTYVH